MQQTSLLGTLSHRLTSKRGARITVVAVLAIIIGVLGAFSGAEGPGGSAQAPADSESARASELLDTFPGADEQSLLIVATRDDGGELTDADLSALERDDEKPIVSEDGEAAIVILPVTVTDDNTENAEVIGDVRDTIAADTPAGLTLTVTGGPAFGADVAAAFDGADFTLLAVTIAIVAVLLIVTYRSPVLWLIPLLVVALADRVASIATALLGTAFDLQFDAGIISVLVFGAGTNYALLMISRYREELRMRDDHREALAAAWRGAVPAIIASNITVVLSLLTLVLAVIPGTRGLGLSSAAGLLIALVVSITLLPAVLALCGRRIFWPFVPKPSAETDGSGAAAPSGAWHAIATAVSQRPIRSLVAGGVLLAVMLTGLAGTTVGLTQVEKFRVPSESAVGLETLSEHFAPGEAQPTLIVTDSDATAEVVDAARDVEGVVRAHPAGENESANLTRVMVVSDYAPGTPEAIEQVREIRDAVHAVPDADALVGGGVATDVDARDGNTRDFMTVAPLVLAVSLLVLLVLLRSVIAPILLLLVNIVSAAAAIGAGSWLSRTLFDQPALDLQVPLLAFLFLVALGIDYTIFLVHRARQEAAVHGTREGMVHAVSHTGSVITSAGIVLAAVFAALGVLPLVTLGQLGLIVGVGVIVDTLIVRTVIVPALFSLIGDRIWWPGRALSTHRDPAPAE